MMSLSVAPTVSRGTAPLLQPFYYTSSLFVEPMREDISGLLSAFAAAYAAEPIEPKKPFQLFKDIWQGEGWELIHLKVLDARARVSFLRTVIRLFVERMEPVEHPLIRVGAIFGLATFYLIQPESYTAGIQTVEYITLNMDTYEQLLVFPSALQPSLRSYVTYIISQFLSLQAFHLIPSASLGAQNPRTLPHTIPLLTRNIDHGHKKKTGRPSQLARSQRADGVLSALESFVDPIGNREERVAWSIQGSTASPTLPERPLPIDYVVLKERLRSTVPLDTVKAAESLTMERMRDAERHVTDNNLPLGDREGIERLNDASTQPHGLLGLVDIIEMDDK